MEDFSRYNGEGTLLRKAQMRMLDILVEIDKVCRNNNIAYWLDSGTLIGAVRHGGFIPWDDDMDICVLKKDYKRLRECLMKELPEQFVLADWKTDKNFYDRCGRVKDRKSKFETPLFRFQKEKGLYVDIIIVDKTVPALKSIISPIYGPLFRQVHNFGKAIYDSDRKRILMKSLSCIMYPISCIMVASASLAAHAFNVKSYMIDYSSMFKSIRMEDDIFPLKEVTFEGKKFLAPFNSDSYLKRIYGDYMKLPPEDQRGGHMFEISFNED